MFAQSPLELAVLPRAQLSWQKGLPRAKPLAFQTTIPRWKTSVSFHGDWWWCVQTLLWPERSHIAWLLPMHESARFRWSCFVYIKTVAGGSQRPKSHEKWWAWVEYLKAIRVLAMSSVKVRLTLRHHQPQESFRAMKFTIKHAQPPTLQHIPFR